jgi:Na+/melibiose symporter-like transporter
VNFLKSLVVFYEKEKTYVAGVAMLVLACAALYTNALSDTQFMTLALVAIGMLGLHDKATTVAATLQEFIDSEKAEKAARQARIRKTLVDLAEKHGQEGETK